MGAGDAGVEIGAAAADRKLSSSREVGERAVAALSWDGAEAALVAVVAVAVVVGEEEEEEEAADEVPLRRDNSVWL